MLTIVKAFPIYHLCYYYFIMLYIIHNFLFWRTLHNHHLSPNKLLKVAVLCFFYSGCFPFVPLVLLPGCWVGGTCTVCFGCWGCWGCYLLPFVSPNKSAKFFSVFFGLGLVIVTPTPTYEAFCITFYPCLICYLDGIVTVTCCWPEEVCLGLVPNIEKTLSFETLLELELVDWDGDFLYLACCYFWAYILRASYCFANCCCLRYCYFFLIYYCLLISFYLFYF